MKHKSILLLFSLIFIIGCKPLAEDPLASSTFYGSGGSGEWFTKTHYPPQYKPTEAVAIGADTLTAKPELANAILASNADLVVSATSPASAQQQIDSLNLSPEQRQRVKISQTTSSDRWIRDFGPIAAVNPQTGKHVFIDQRYYPSRPSEDSVPEGLAKTYGAERKELDAHNEGGNVMMCEQGDDNVCIMSDRIFAGDLSKGLEDRSLATKVNELTSKYKEATGAQRVAILPNLSQYGEQTGHVDIYARALKNGVMMVHDLPEEAVDAASSTQEAERYLKIRKTLNEAASRLEKQGFKVERSVMPPPSGGTFYTHTNALPVNGNMIMPTYQNNIQELQTVYSNGGCEPKGAGLVGLSRIGGNSMSPEDCARLKSRLSLFRKAEENAQDIYRKYDYNIKPIESTDTIRLGGAIHCTTQQIPAIPGMPNQLPKCLPGQSPTSPPVNQLPQPMMYPGNGQPQFQSPNAIPGGF